jgi:hypothetical protein
LEAYFKYLIYIIPKTISIHIIISIKETMVLTKLIVTFVNNFFHIKAHRKAERVVQIINNIFDETNKSIFEK